MGVRSWYLATVLLALISCAKVGDPLPPLVRIPDPVDVRLVQQARDRIELLISTHSDDIKEVEIFRECGSPLPEEFEGQLLVRVKLEDVARHSLTDSFVLEDPEPLFDELCRYQICVRNDQGRRSLPSTTVQTALDPPPGPPTDLKAEVEEQRIKVSWEAPRTSFDGSAPAKVEGYLVNSVHLVSEVQFIDTEFTYGESVGYSVQSIGKLDKPVILSRPSQRLEVVPIDRFAPPAPENLTAVPFDSKVQLLWDSVADSELAGYYVYRGGDPGTLEKSSPLVTINRYVDPDPRVGSMSYYAVTAVDNYGNESVLSKFVTVTVAP